MDRRRDAGLAAAELALAVERIARARGGVGTTGSIDLQPGIITAIAGRAAVGVDLRHPDRGELAAMLEETREAAAVTAGGRSCEHSEQPVWRIEPIPFDRDLVARAEQAAAAAGGRAAAIASGALHDAAELARVVPAAMIFAASQGGVSHSPDEHSSDEDLRAAIAAFGELAGAVLLGAAG
jgi:N-carbamoyl-L-amino-acid hydrolase